MLADIILRIAAEEGKEEDSYTYRPRPSASGPERCLRQLVYHGLGVPRQPLPGRAIMIFSDSSFHEDLTADWIRRSAFHLHSEQMHVNVPAGLSFLPERKCKMVSDGNKCGQIIPAGHLAGHIDGIVTDVLKIDRHYEHKGISHFQFQKYWAGELPLDNISQTCIYNCGLKKLNPDINESLLLIKNKNTAQYLEFLIRYEDDTALIVNRVNSQGETIEMGVEIPNIVDDAFKKFATVQEYIDKKTLPKREYDIDHWRCEYCGWYSHCYKNYAREFNELKTDTQLPDEIADMVAYKQELAAERIDIEHKEDDIKNQVKKIMKELDTREGRAGDRICRLHLLTKETLDKGKIPNKLIKDATKVSHYEKLTISNLKPKENKK